MYVYEFRGPSRAVLQWVEYRDWYPVVTSQRFEVVAFIATSLHADSRSSYELQDPKRTRIFSMICPCNYLLRFRRIGTREGWCLIDSSVARGSIVAIRYTGFSGLRSRRAPGQVQDFRGISDFFNQKKPDLRVLHTESSKGIDSMKCVYRVSQKCCEFLQIYAELRSFRETFSFADSLFDVSFPSYRWKTWTDRV